MHTYRKGGADLKTNSYYNGTKWVGKNSGYNQCGSNYQCTMWAFERCQEDCEKKVIHFTGEEIDNPLFSYAGYRSAKNWFKDSLWDKSVDDVRVGDIVCYGSGCGGGEGHVRYVEKIENNYMYLSGGNEDFKGTVKFDIKVPITKGGGANATGLQGYIHNFYFNENKDIDYKVLYEQAMEKLKRIEGICNE